MAWVTAVPVAAAGLLVGWLTGAAAHRLSRRLSEPPDHPRCGRPPWWPPWVRPRGEPTYRRGVLPALLMAALYAAAWLTYGPEYRGLALMLAYGPLWLALLATDLERRQLPHRLVLPALASAMALASFWPGVGPLRSALGLALGGGVLMAAYLAPRLVLGGGDVKLAAVIGAATGWPLALMALGLAFVGAGLAALALVATRRARVGDVMPLGPFMVTAALATLLWGEAMARWFVTLARGPTP